MKLFTRLICVLMLSFTLLLAIGCESVKRLEGRYVYLDGRNLKYSLIFEDGNVQISYEGEDKGTFEYEYEKSKEDVDKVTLTVDSEAFPWVMEFNYEEKELRCDVDGDGILNVFIKLEE